MFSTDDTIVAIATPPGRGGLGVVRISGADALAISRDLLQLKVALRPRHATLATVRAPHSETGTSRAIDQAIATFFPAPHSYTGDDVVEISTHGSPVVLQAIVSAAVAAGARLARPGEFTLRAFLAGRIDLPQAEAVADLIDAVTPLQAGMAFDQLQGTVTQAIADIEASLFDLIARLEASIDFPDEGFHFIEAAEVSSALTTIADQLSALVSRANHGRIIRDGCLVAIVGAPNAGKSSLFNALVGSARAIVTPMPGTTRDMISEVIDINGLAVTLVDTAGLRESDDPIEREGVRRSREAAQHAEAIVLVSDGTRAGGGAEGGNSDGRHAGESVESWLPESGLGAHVVRVRSKCDRPGFQPAEGWLSVSALSGFGLDALRVELLGAIIGVNSLQPHNSVERPNISNIRHLHLIEKAHSAVERAVAAFESAERQLPEEFLLADLQEARMHLEEVSGKRTSDDLLAHIFSRFCVGK